MSTTTGLVAVAKALEGLIGESPLSKMWIFESYRNESVASTYLFVRAEDKENAKRLEEAHASGLLTDYEFEAEFPKVFHISVNARYCVGHVAFAAEQSFACEGARLLMPGLEDKLTDLSAELCFGLENVYVPEDESFHGNLLAIIDFSPNGNVSEVVYCGHYMPKLPLKTGDNISVSEAFKALERYITING